MMDKRGNRMERCLGNHVWTDVWLCLWAGRKIDESKMVDEYKTVETRDRQTDGWADGFTPCQG